MNLPVNPPILPMLAKRVSELPPGDGWIFEPQWDGFRTLVFRDGDEIFIQSRDEKPLDRYFPELIEPLKAQLPERCVLDGEIVIAHDGALDFEALQLRLHPAASRVKKLAGEMPASVAISETRRSGSDAPSSNRCSPVRRRHCISRRPPPTAMLRPIGSVGSRALASTASWRSCRPRSTSRTSASRSR
jgi:hypothetical protein